MFFANDNRDKVREENPGISFGKSFPPSRRVAVALSYSLVYVVANNPPGQVGKSLGDRWKALTESERKPYDAKAATDRKRYEEEKKAYANVSLIDSFSFISSTNPRIEGCRRGGGRVVLNVMLPLYQVSGPLGVGVVSSLFPRSLR
jgi:hypothetical protein